MKNHSIDKHIKVGEVEVPIDYFSFKTNEKEALCLKLMDSMLHMLDKQLNPELNRMDILDRLLESSIETNIQMEEYEICQVLSDIRTLMND